MQAVRKQYLQHKSIRIKLNLTYLLQFLDIADIIIVFRSAKQRILGEHTMAYGKIFGLSRYLNFSVAESKCPDIVYHYTSPEALINILKTGKIRFYDYRFMNDSSEFIYIDSLIEKILPEFPSLQKELNQYLTSTDQRGVFPRSVETLGPLFSERTKHYYLFCTSTESDSLSMWRYYIKNDKYQGVNIGFHPETIGLNIAINTNQSNVEAILHGPVIYDTAQQVQCIKHIFQEEQDRLTNPSRSAENIAFLIEKINECRIFFKHPAFTDEQEYRFIIVENTAFKHLVSRKSPYEKNFIVKNGYFTSYCELNFLLDKSSPIHNITLAPSSASNFALLREGIQEYITQLNDQYASIHINQSHIPVRY